MNLDKVLKKEPLEKAVCEWVEGSQTLTCNELYNCCSCGDNGCGCAYCFDCNACEVCWEESLLDQ